MSVEDIFHVTDEERKEVNKLCSPIEKDINEDIKILREWISKQQHLPQDDVDSWLKFMLYSNKFSMEKTKKKVDMYHSIKNIIPEYFENREPSHPSMEHVFKDFIFMPLPNLNNLERIYYTKLLDDGSKFNMLNFNKVVFGTYDLRGLHDCCIGESFIVDFSNITLRHVTSLSPVQLKHVFDITQNAYSDRIMSLDFINVSTMGTAFINIIISVLSEKLKKKVRVHKSINDLLKFYSLKVLPNELGGTAGKIEDLYEQWLKFYRSQNDWLKKVGLRRSDENKRIGEPLNSDMFGMCGSFRKLNVD